MIMDPLQKFRALIMASCSKILATTKDKPSKHLGVSNANLGDKKEAQNSTHQLREAPGTNDAYTVLTLAYMHIPVCLLAHAEKGTYVKSTASLL